MADNILPALRQEHPHLVPRLAACYYWAIITDGQPEDLARYRRVFGPPPDDPNFDRLQALANEQIHELPDAHKHWQQFEQWVADNPGAWPGDQARRVRALVWTRMGCNAAAVPDPDKIPNLPPFLRNHPERPRPLVPSAEQCFQRSLELAPDRLAGYENLFHFYQEEEKDNKAEEVARRLLARFPDHVPTLEALAGLRMQHQDYAAALALYQHAMKLNPLDRRLRLKLSTAHTFKARAHAEAARFTEARPEYQAALALDERKDHHAVLCKWAACEFKAGESARAEELLGQALAGAGARLAVAYSMLIECIRLKLPRPLKNRFDQEFKQSLLEPPTAAGAAAVADTAAVHRLAGVVYHGQKTHEKKVLAYLDKAAKAEFTEELLESVCKSLLGLQATKQLRACTALGRRRFPRSPFFPFAEAQSYLALGPSRCPIWRVQPLLAEAARLAAELPPHAKHKDLLQEIHERQKLLDAMNPHSMRVMQEMFGGMFGDEDDWDEDPEWYLDDDDDDELPFDAFDRPRGQKRRRRR
jgi:tetratricopeptide (TPR) repeat protein